MPSIRLVTDSPASIDTDLLVVPVFDGESLAEAFQALETATGGEIGRASASGEIRGRLYEFFVTPATGWKARRIAAGVTKNS